MYGETDWCRPAPTVPFEPEALAAEFAASSAGDGGGASPPEATGGGGADARLREMDALLADLARKEEALRAAETPLPPRPPSPPEVDPVPSPAATPSPERPADGTRWPFQGASPYLDIPADELDGFTQFFSGRAAGGRGAGQSGGGPPPASPGSRAVESGLRGAPFCLERAYNSARSPPRRKPKRRQRPALPPMDAPPALRARLERLPRDALLRVAEALLDFALGRAARLPQPALGLVRALDQHLPPDPAPPPAPRLTPIP